MFRKIISMMVVIGGINLLGVCQPRTAWADDTTATSSQASTGIDPQLTLTGGNRLLVGQHQQLIGRVINNTVHPRWSSSNPRVIKVNQSGEIKGLKAGKATVKISYHNVAKYKTIRVVQ